MPKTSELTYFPDEHIIKNGLGETELNFANYFEGRERKDLLAELSRVQIALYIMCGGGFIGDFAVRQPDEFYVDDRGKTPYSVPDILKALVFYSAFLKELGIDKNDIPRMPFVPHMCVM